MKKILFVCVVLFAFPLFAAEVSKSVPDQLQQISVTIKAGSAQGSGTLVTRQVGSDTLTFVWTAAHVVADLRTTRTIINKDGGRKIVVEFKDPQIVQERQQDGRRVGEVKYDAKVIKYSDADYGHDLSLLMVRCKNAYPATVTAKFAPDPEYVPQVGVELCHCGSLLGQFGANSYTEGVLSQIGRVLEQKGANSQVFDQVTTVAFPGSSGGGMFLRGSGEYVGMLTQGVMQLQGFNFIVPVRRMHEWAKDADVEWSINQKTAMPNLQDIMKIQVEDSGSAESSGKSYEEISNVGNDKPIVVPLIKK